jgi:putative Mg2+ transporter-C (MgtC) family protein
MPVPLFTSSTPVELCLLGLAFVLSAVVGLERQRRMKSAGLRTHTLVGLGAAIFTLVSAYGFAGVLGPDVALDPSRIAAQIVSGIGFLGAGVIFVRQNVVNGLTTAASIWVTASIGMACGAGMPVVAVAATLLYLLTVGLLTLVGRRISPTDREQRVVIRYKDGRGVLRSVLSTATDLGYQASLGWSRQIEIPGKGARVEAALLFWREKPGRAEGLLEELTAIKGVVSVRTAGQELD